MASRFRGNDDPSAALFLTHDHEPLPIRRDVIHRVEADIVRRPEQHRLRATHWQRTANRRAEPHRDQRAVAPVVELSPVAAPDWVHASAQRDRHTLLTGMRVRIEIHLGTPRFVRGVRDPSPIRAHLDTEGPPSMFIELRRASLGDDAGLVGAAGLERTLPVAR